jgi:hypothetical protein
MEGNNKNNKIIERVGGKNSKIGDEKVKPFCFS